MMTCRKATELHTEAAEGKLSPATKLRYDCHMLVCGVCKCYREQLETTTEALRKIPREEPPAGLVDLLAAEIEKKT